MPFATEKQRFEKAEKIHDEDWTGWVYTDAVPSEVEDYAVVEAKDGYWESVEDLKKSIYAYNGDCDEEDDMLELPEYAWACKECRLRHQTAEDIFAERMDEEVFEEAWQGVSNKEIAALDAALKKFYEHTDTIVGQAVDYKKAILLTRPKACKSN